MMASAIEQLGQHAIARKGFVSAHKWLVLRRVSQLSILGFFLLGPAFGIWILKGNLSSSLFLDRIPMTDPMLFLQMLAAGHFRVASAAITGAAIIAAFYLLVGGRVYCSWVCPVNIVTDSAHWLRRRLAIKTSARIGRSTRLWLLGAVFILPLVTGTLAYELVNPVSMLHRGLIFGIGGAWAVVLGVFLFDLFVMNRGWCGHLCPVGAFYGLIGSASLVRVRADKRDACDDCMECYEVCPEPQVIPPALKGTPGDDGKANKVIRSGSCTNCARCIEICPHDVFNFGLRFGPAAIEHQEPETQQTARYGT